MSRRLEKVDEFLKQEISKAITKLNDAEFGIVTVTKVKTQKDLKGCKVWVSIISSDPRGSFEALSKRIYEVQEIVTKRVTFKYTPKIELKYDDSGEYVERIEKIIKDLKEDDNKQ